MKLPLRWTKTCLLGFLTFVLAGSPQSSSSLGIPYNQEYVVIGWNDLGMHCMGPDFSGLCILPPYNNLWAQVIRRGDPPHLITSGVTLDYRFPANTTSANKVNFWDYSNQLFGVVLQDDEGLTHNKLTGQMTWNGSAYEASGVPLTPFEDAAPTTLRPYQIAEVTLKSTANSTQLDQTQFVAPVSTEMHCDKCHHSSSTRTTWDSILSKHDEEEGTHLLASKPVLCANCHGSNALGMTGNPSLPNLSRAIHHKHADEVSNLSCYDCHPGQQTQCLRGAMYLAGKDCTNCHGTLQQVASSISQGRRPWIDEPKCATCHPSYPENAGKLYRNSIGHGGIYCAACHNSPHSELPSAEPLDRVQAIRLQNSATPLRNCLICHTKPPTGPGPHGLTAPANATSERQWILFN